jgi:hypothetical protein
MISVISVRIRSVFIPSSMPGPSNVSGCSLQCPDPTTNIGPRTECTDLEVHPTDRSVAREKHILDDRGIEKVVN